MFVAFDLAHAPWHKINATSGVSRLVSFGTTPQPLPDDLVAGLMARCDETGKLLPAKQLTAGEKVELLTGPFAEFVGTIETIDADRRVWVLLDFMGQKTRTQLPTTQVQRAH